MSSARLRPGMELRQLGIGQPGRRRRAHRLQPRRDLRRTGSLLVEDRRDIGIKREPPCSGRSRRPI